ncbi:MAG: DNA helicase RecQ [Clostridia bacterium]
MDKFELLKKYFGYEQFRYPQEPIIDTVLAGKDVLGVMPTGAGKSLCYQIPALMLPGITLVISPLISLMKDQVSALIKMGIPAAYINATLTPSQTKTVLQRGREGRYKLIYVAPERLSSSDFLKLCGSVDVSLVAVDEAHCVSQWGHDFRSAYLTIPDFIHRLPKRPLMAAFTATATEEVRRDIRRLLGLRDPEIYVSGFDRPNLFFDVRRPQSKFNELLRILKDHPHESGIIYCATRKTVEEVAARLNQMGYEATRYHAGLSDRERKENQDDFLFDRKPVMAATNAFGMGIDKSNVSFVVHYNMPKNIESYYQEAGRAGRDGEPAECILLYEKKDIVINRYFIEHSTENNGLDPGIRQKIRENELKQLNEMIHYCTSDQCLRNMILQYFGETAEEPCGNCANCCHDFIVEDRTDEYFTILTCVDEVRQRFGSTMVADILKGSRNKRIRSLNLSLLSSYGMMSDRKVSEIKKFIDDLMDQEYLFITDDEYPVIGLTEKGRDVLEGEARVAIRRREDDTEDGPTKNETRPKQVLTPLDELYEVLRQKRNEMAEAEGIPAYVIFSNATLRDMSRKQPRTSAELLNVSGVGKVKQQRYGAVFLKVIGDFFGEPILDDTSAEIENSGGFYETDEDVFSFFEEEPFSSEPPPAWEKDEDGSYQEAIDPDWSDEDDGKLLIFLGTDWSLDAMAEYFQKTPNEIFQRLKDLGMIRKPTL